MNKDKDIVIRLGEEEKDDAIEYNVTEFLKKIKLMEESTIKRINDFTEALDKKVHVDSTDPRYSKIYGDIDTIVKRIITELTKVNQRYDNAILIPTGSVCSGVKVGIPHETDYLIAIGESMGPRWEEQYVDEMIASIREILNYKSDILTNSIGPWIIHGLEETRVGCCLILQYGADTGATVDLVPVFHVKNVDKYMFHEKVEAYLKRKLSHYHAKGLLHKVANSYSVDTGLIENEIVRDLNQGKKMGFRVAKYLIQYVVTGHKLHEYRCTKGIPSEEKLFGYKPFIRSYYIRLCLVSLLVHTHGHTEAENTLTGGVLVLCLLDMLQHLYCDGSGKRDTKYDVDLDHPLLNTFFIDFPKHRRGHRDSSHMKRLSQLVNHYAISPPYDDLDFYEMLSVSAPQMKIKLVPSDKWDNIPLFRHCSYCYK